MIEMLEKKLEMNDLFDLNHRALRSKKHVERIYKAATTKDKKQGIIKLRTFNEMPYYNQTGRVKGGKKITFDSELLIDTNKEKIVGFTNTLAKLRLIYEKLDTGFMKYAGHLPRYHTFFNPPYALLDDNLGILEQNRFSGPVALNRPLNYDEMLKLGGCIKIFSEYDFDSNPVWSSYGKTVDSLEKVINKEMHPGLAKIFDNVPRAVCGINWQSLYPIIIFDNKVPLTNFPLVYPELLEVKPKYKTELKKYKSQYDANCEAFRIHKL